MDYEKYLIVGDLLVYVFVAEFILLSMVLVLIYFNKKCRSIDL
jgi:hypothetical protein